MRRLPAVPIAWGVALTVKIGLAVKGQSALNLAHRLASGWSVHRVSASPSDAVAIVHRLVPGTHRPGRCLFRALVRFGLLCRTGTDTASFCLGVRSPEAARRFAHAWVEVNGTPIGEPSAPRDTHQLLVQYDSSSETPVMESTRARTLSDDD